MHKSAFEIFISKYADSINNATNVTSLPYFLKNAQFDYVNSGIWSPAHQPISLRTIIIDSVINCKSLKLIIDSKDVGYRKIPKRMHDIDVNNLNLSFYDLVVRRYKELKCF